MKYFKNLPDIKFEMPNLNFFLNNYKTNCDAGNVLNVTEKVLGGMSCNFEFAILKFLEIDFFFRIII